MDKNYAIKLIQDVFQNPFNRDRFVTFTKNLFNFLDTEKNFVYRGNFIPDAYKPFINTLERIGKYEDAEENKIDVLIVHLKKEYSIEHARTMQRNFIAWYLSGSRGGELKDAALVAFHTDNPDDWRFSLVKMGYQIVESETGKIKTKTELTPARRFSFLVGENENSHTAQRQLLPILQDNKNNPLLSDFEKAFNIEVVTQEFFEKYKSLFLDVKDSLERLMKKDQAIARDFVDKGVDPVDFSKKLLGQIVFLYFLQKKGWFGVARDEDWGTGPKDFLRRLFEKQLSDYDNFFNNILEPLFYEALAIERPDDFYSRFDCKIPFLNGGLFDPLGNYDWVHTDIRLPDELFSNDRKTKEGDIGDGILDIFDRYNFTVKEDEPLEKEVAVDPEMLGKVFENLLEVKDRKSKGTYYTPREIVHYMCQESLINYLVNECEEKVNREDIKTLIQYGETSVEHDALYIEKISKDASYKGRYDKAKLPKSIQQNAILIDEKLASIRVCDPAVGSGAFPVGMMNEIIRIRNALTPYIGKNGERSSYNFKRHAIQNCLYGVDIDSGAVEIAKLRLWLSLVVDEEDIKQIKPLPNLDYKIMQGNSLLEEFEGVQLFDDRLLNSYIPANDDQIKKLEAREKEIQKNLMTYYQKNPLWMKNQKIERPTELYQFEGELKRVQLAIKDEKEVRFQIKDPNQNALFSDEQKARKIWEELQSLQKKFFETAQKREKDELKKQVEKLEWELIEATLKEQDKESSLKKLEQYKRKNIKPFFLWKLHFSDVFQEKGGFDVVIANPPYIGQKGNKELFRNMKNNPNFEKKMDYWYFFLHLASDISDTNGITTFITPNYWITAQGGKKIRNKIVSYFKIIEYINFNENKIFEAGVHTNVFILQKGSPHNNQVRCLIFNNIYESDFLVNRGKEQNFFVKQNLILSSWTGFVHFLPEKVLSIISKLLINCEKLSDNETTGIKKSGVTSGKKVTDGICNVNQGIVTGKDRFIDKENNINTGVFVLNQTEVSRLNLNKEEVKYIKPFFKNSDIDRYYINIRSKYFLLYVNKVEKEPELKKLSQIYQHLNKYKKVLAERSINGVLESAYTRGKWWVLTTDRPNINFLAEKILCPQRSSINTFAYSDGEWYSASDVFYISSNKKEYSLKYILSILNSQLVYFWLYYMGKRKGNILEQTLEPLQFIPIKKISLNNQKPFIEVVDKILALTSSSDYLSNTGKQARVKDYEKQIDQLAYKLYDLTPEEIAIVEGKK